MGDEFRRRIAPTLAVLRSLAGGDYEIRSGESVENDIEKIFSDTSTEQRGVPVKYYDQFNGEHYIGTARIFWTQGRKVIVLDGGLDEEIHEVVVKPPPLKAENGFLQ